MGSQSTTTHAQRSKYATAVAVWLLGLTIFFAIAPMTAHARWYDPERGRFMSRDPMGFVDGPNVYAFTLNNPVNFTDPEGLSVYSFTKCMAECIADNDPIDSFIAKALGALAGQPLPKTFIAQLYRLAGLNRQADLVLATMKIPGASRVTTIPSALSAALRSGGRSTLRMLGRYASHVWVAYGLALAGVEAACLGQCLGADDYCPGTDLNNVPFL